jgi:hypothetical protein
MTHNLSRVSTLHMVTTMEPHRPPFFFLRSHNCTPMSGSGVWGPGVRASHQADEGSIDHGGLTPDSAEPGVCVLQRLGERRRRGA